MAKTKRVPCICKSEYQDQKYGKGMRIMNITDKGKTATSTTWRCSVCKREVVK